MVSDANPTRVSQARSALFLIALPICVVVALWGIIDPDALVRVADAITTTLFRALDWFYLTLILFFLGLSVWLALGPHGHLKLGNPDDTPEFSTLSWLAMLFAAGMGAGLLYWGVAEPLLHFTQAPGDTPGTSAAARQALVITIFHWGIHGWAVYCIAALILAYFGFRRQEPYLPGAPIRSALRGRWVGGVAWLADLLATLAVALGVAGAIGMGILQLQSGLHIVAGVSPDAPLVSVIILVLVVLSYMISAGTGLDKGIKILSNINMALGILLMLFIAIAGPTGALLRGLVSAVGDYTSSLFSLSFQLYPYESPAVSAWFHSWTLTYFIWWISWAPFVGVFIARISRGRTIREFVLGVLVVPTAFTILWFSIFGGMGLHEELLGAGGMGELVRQDVSTALFSLFDRLPGSLLLSVIGLVLVFIFVVTSVDSATFVLGMLTSQGSMNPPVRRKLAWGVTLGGLGAALMFSGSPAAVKAVSVVAALPFTLVLILQVVALLRALAHDAVAENNA
ncbi:MAG: BCCT family transporter [Candidatus Tectomicrobia bacterium]|nr:BCCT family transporter [Candidatus Tectomicrobia bacterium]